MTSFEFMYLVLEPFVGRPVHYVIRRRLKSIARRYGPNPKILDVGGRKSHYTIGIHGTVTVTDLPRETNLQEELHLGINRALVEQLRRRRTNISEVLLDDMTKSSLHNDSFDCVVAVEVLEHVEEDAEFVQQVHRILRPGGAFVMTTPNGDHVANSNPDHKRHYSRSQLEDLLGANVGPTEVEYAIPDGEWSQRLGLKSLSLRRPFRASAPMVSNAVNLAQSQYLSRVRRLPIAQMGHRTRKLIALSIKDDARKVENPQP